MLNLLSRFCFAIIGMPIKLLSRIIFKSRNLSILYIRMLPMFIIEYMFKLF